MGSLFARPATTPRVLSAAPVLESWEATGHPDQRRLRRYLDEVEMLADGCVPAAADHLVLELAVGLPAGTALISGGRDLDNYLLPVARRIGPGPPRRTRRAARTTEHRSIRIRNHVSLQQLPRIVRTQQHRRGPASLRSVPVSLPMAACDAWPVWLDR
jgi:hypothetical protein